MSDTMTIQMIEAYRSMASPTMFLSSLFQSPPRNFYNSEEVEIDIVRDTEQVSVAIQDLSEGYRMNSEDIYTNKRFKPPVHREAAILNSVDLLKRTAGSNPFESLDYRTSLMTRMFAQMTKVEAKIRRSIELQASQVLQTGKVNLIDSTDATVYSIDYKPKSSHFTTAGTSWASASAKQMIADLSKLAEQIRSDGLVDPDQLIMGVDAFNALIATEGFKSLLDTRRIDQGRVSPMVMRSDGGSYRGVLEIGNYRFDLWTYGGRYATAKDATSTQYLNTEKVIVRASGARMDATFGGIPNIGTMMGAGSQLLPELPNRMTNAAGGMDLFVNVWLSTDGEQLYGGVGSRPLLIPTAIDTYGCLDSNIT